MAEYYPSEIARLVLGYLKEANCPKAWETFLVESVDLKEHRRLWQSGRSCSTNIEGKSLLEILRDYCHLKDAAERKRRNEITLSLANLNVSCADLKSNNINPNAFFTESFQTLKKNNAESLDSSKIRQTVQSQAAVHFFEGGNRSPWNVQTHSSILARSHLYRTPIHLKRVCVKALNFGADGERNEEPLSGHQRNFEPITRHASARQFVRESIASRRFCHSNPSERNPAMLSRMVQTETSQVIVDNGSCQTSSDSPFQERHSENSSNKYFHQFTTSINSSNYCTKDQLQSDTESKFLTKVDRKEKLNGSRSLLPEEEDSADMVVVNQTTVFTSTEIRTIEDKRYSETPQRNSEPPPYSRAPSIDSPRLMLSLNRTQVTSFATPVKDRKQWTEEFASPIVKSTTPRRLLNEFPHLEPIESNECSCVAIHENVESLFEEDTASQHFTQRLADITTVIGEDTLASNSSCFPTIQDIQNSDLVMQNILAGEDSLFNDRFSYSDSRDCNNSNAQESAVETSNGKFLMTEGTEANKDECEIADIETMITKPETNSSKQHGNTQEKNNSQNSKNGTYSQLSLSSEDVILDSESAIEQNSSTTAFVEVPDPMHVDNDKTNLTQIPCSKDVLDPCVSIAQPDAENQFQNCNFDQNNDHTDNVIDMQSMAFKVNEGSSLVSASVAEKLTIIDGASALKPVSIGTHLQIGTQMGPQSACSINQLVSTTQTIVSCPSSSVTNSRIPFIPNKTYKPILPAIQNQGFVLNPNFQISAFSTSGFPVEPLNHLQSNFIMIQPPYPSFSINAANWTNSDLKSADNPVQTVPAENLAQSQSSLANLVITASETAQPKKKAKISLDKKRSQKSSKKKSASFKQKMSSKSPSCSSSKSANDKKKGYYKCTTKDKIDVTSDFVTTTIEKLTSNKGVSSSMSDAVLNAMQEALLSKPVKGKKQDSSAIYNLFLRAEISLSPTKKSPLKSSSSCKKMAAPTDQFSPKSSFVSDSESDNIPLSVLVASKLKETAHKQNYLQKSNLEIETDKNVEEMFPSINTSSVKGCASNKIESKGLGHIQPKTFNRSKEISGVKSTQPYNSSEMTGISPSNPIVLGSDEDMSETGNANVASHVMCDNESISSKKIKKKIYPKLASPSKEKSSKKVSWKKSDPKSASPLKENSSKKVRRKKSDPKSALPSKEKILGHKNSKRKNSAVSQKISETSDNLLQYEKDDPVIEKSNYKVPQESFTEKRTLCIDKSKAKDADLYQKLKEKINIQETNNPPLFNEETYFLSPETEYRASLISAMEKKQESGQKDGWYISSPQNDKEVCHPSSCENSQYSWGGIFCRTIDEFCDKIKLNQSSSKEETVKPSTKTDKLLNTMVRNSTEIPANETSLQHESLPLETIASKNPTVSVEVLQEDKSRMNTEVANIIPDFKGNINFKQSSIDYQHGKPNDERRVLPFKKRIRPIPIASPRSFSSPVHGVCFDSTSNLKDMPSITRNPSDSEVNKIVSYQLELCSPTHNGVSVCFDSTSSSKVIPPLTVNTSNADINETIASPPYLNSPANAVCFYSPSKPREMPSLSPITDDAGRKCSSLNPGAMVGFHKSALSDHESNPTINFDSMSSSLCMVDSFPARQNLPSADTFKTSPNKENRLVDNISPEKTGQATCQVDILPTKKILSSAHTLKAYPDKENCPVDKISPEKKGAGKVGQKRKLASISMKNSAGEIVLPSSYASSQVHLKDKKPKFRMKINPFTEQIPAGVKIPTKWSKSKITDYSSIISRPEDDMSSKVPKRSRPNIKKVGVKSSLKTSSCFKRKAEYPLDLSKQTKS